MKTRTRPTCPECARRFDRANVAKGGWRFFEPCGPCSPGSLENLEKKAREKRAAESAGQVVEPTPSPDPDAQASAQTLCEIVCGCGRKVGFDRIRGLGRFRTATLTLIGGFGGESGYRPQAAVALPEGFDGYNVPLAEWPISDVVCAGCALSRIVQDAAAGRGATEVWTVEASQASRAAGRR